MLKNALLALLVCLNLVLLSGIILLTTSEPVAYAQAAGQPPAAPPAEPATPKAEEVAAAAEAAGVGGLGGNFLVVAGEIQDQYDALYLLDQGSRNLYAFRYDRGRRELELMAARDLEADFRNNRGGGK